MLVIELAHVLVVDPLPEMDQFRPPPADPLPEPLVVTQDVHWYVESFPQGTFVPREHVATEPSADGSPAPPESSPHESNSGSHG